MRGFIVLVAALLLAPPIEGGAADESPPDDLIAERTLHLGHVFRSPKTYLAHKKSKKGTYGPPKGHHKHQPDVCHVIIQSVTFDLKSPSYPLAYPTGVDCIYIVQRLAASTCWVQIELLDFQLDTSSKCDGDWLLMERRRYCGLQPPRKVLIPFGNAAEVVLRFHSDLLHSNSRGFHLIGQQLPCYYPPPPTIRPHPHPYPPTIRPHPYPPPTIRPPTPTPGPVPPPDRCDVIFNSPLGQLQSPNYPGPYAPLLACQFRFELTAGFCTLELSFQDFDLEDSRGCDKDALILGRNRYCANSLNNQRVRLTGRAGESIDMEFVSDSAEAGGSGRGFRATYRLLPCGDAPTTSAPFTTPPGVTCDRSFNEEESFVTSVNYPLPYIKNLDCIYRVDKWSPVVNELEISFIAFDLPQSELCLGDHVEIDGQRYCGPLTGKTLTIPFLSPYTEMKFHSDSQDENTGFNIRIRQQDHQATTAPPITTAPSNVCGDQLFDIANFLMVSPQFPLLYAPGQRCNYYVVKSSQDVCELQLKLTLFSLAGQADDCQGDFLQTPGPDRLCGELSGQTRRIPFVDDSQLIFTFQSDLKNDPAQGFSIQAIQVTDCSPYAGRIPGPFPFKIEQPLCNVALAPPTNYVTSVSLQNEGLQTCAYDIVHQPGICGVELFFHEFYITPTANCSENYLMIENRRFCGQQLNEIKIDVSYTVDGSAIHLPFHIKDNKKFAWNFTTSAITCPTLGKVCSPSVWASEGEFNYTNRDFEFVQCQFIIRRWSRRVCRIELDFQQFEMIQENNCLLNHFEVGGEHLCGNHTGRKIIIDFPASEETIRLPLLHENPVAIQMGVKQIQCHQ